jgi:hypothetical protein
MAGRVKTAGGRTLRTAYSVVWSNGRWTVGSGLGRGGMTIYEARAEAKRRNAKSKCK